MELLTRELSKSWEVEGLLFTKSMAFCNSLLVTFVVYQKQFDHSTVCSDYKGEVNIRDIEINQYTDSKKLTRKPITELAES